MPENERNVTDVRLRVGTPHKEPSDLAGQAEKSAVAGRADRRSAATLPMLENEHWQYAEVILPPLPEGATRRRIFVSTPQGTYW